MSWRALGDDATKLERFALLTVILALVFALGFAIWATREVVVTGNETTEAYVIDSPIEVTNRVTGFDGPAEHIGVAWHTRTFRCLSDIDLPAVANFSVTWVNRDSTTVIVGVDGSVVIEEGNDGGAGCEGSDKPPIVSELTPPDEVTPGVWRFNSDLNIETLDGEHLTETVSVSDWVHVVPEDE